MSPVDSLARLMAATALGVSLGSVVALCIVGAPKATPVFDSKEYINICLETGGNPKLVEMDEYGPVMACDYPHDMNTTFGETRDKASA
jgi:hypothetical protein